MARPATDPGQALPRTTDTSGRTVGSEAKPTSTQVAPRETHRITPSGSIPRTGR